MNTSIIGCGNMSSALNIGIIGCGNMAAAIIKGIFSIPEFKNFNYFIYDIDEKKTASISAEYNDFSITVCKDEINAAKNSDYLLLAVKPQNFIELLSKIKPIITSEKILISIAAGITIQKITDSICGCNSEKQIKIARIMPNTPALIQKGMSGIAFNSFINEAEKNFVIKIFSSLGKIIVVEENKINSITAVSGSGPAYVFYFAECFLEAARNLGFSMDDAELLVFQTIKGSVDLMLESADTPAELRKKVTSPGGTTEAAINNFIKNNFKSIIIESADSARKRADELGK